MLPGDEIEGAASESAASAEPVSPSPPAESPPAPKVGRGPPIRKGDSTRDRIVLDLADRVSALERREEPPPDLPDDPKPSWWDLLWQDPD